jgi:hypothetical protein
MVTGPTATAYGQTVTCAATVMPTGPVQFWVDVTNLGSPVTVGGAPSVRTCVLAARPHSGTSQWATCDSSTLTSVATVMFGKKPQASRHRKRLRMLRSMGRMAPRSW